MLYEAIGYQENEVDPTFHREVSINRETERESQAVPGYRLQSLKRSTFPLER